LIGYGFDAYINGGKWAGEHQLDSFGVPLTHVRYDGETNSTTKLLCHSAGCTEVIRTYALLKFQHLSAVEAAVTRRMRQLGYKVVSTWFTANDYENNIPAMWQFACSVDGRLGAKDLLAVIHMSGVDPGYVPRLGPPPYSPTGSVESTDVPRPPGDPVVTELELNASG
jgi:hypothetical protein